MAFSKKLNCFQITSFLALSLLLSCPISYGEENSTAADKESAAKEADKQAKKKKEEGYYASFMNSQREEESKKEAEKEKSEPEKGGAGYYSSFTTKREMPYAVIPKEMLAPAPIPALPEVKNAPALPIPPVINPATTIPGWKDNIGETGSITITRHITQAREFAKNGQYDLAKRHFREAIRLSPDSFDYAIDFYKASMKANDWPEAVQTLDKLMYRDPQQQKDFLADYGHSLFKNNDFEKAVFILRKAAGAGKNLEQIHRDLLSIYLLQSKSDLAVGEYEQVLKFNNNDADIHADYATLLWRLDRLPQAIVHYKAAARIKPGDAKIQGNLGYALLYAKDYAGSVAAYKKAVSLNPSDAKLQEGLKAANQRLAAENQ